MRKRSVFRKPSLKASFKARTTGRAKRAVKRAIIPGYGKKGTGFIKNPKRSMYNAVYHRNALAGNFVVFVAQFAEDFIDD